MEHLLQKLQVTLLQEIPITQYLGITVESYDEQRLILRAPLAQNINHKGTAFAGSLNALLTLAGWGQLWLILAERNIPGKIVIQDSSSSYLLPVHSDFYAICHKPSVEHIMRVENTLKKYGKARIELQAEIHDDQALAVSFKGRYVVHLADEQ
jgi:thioesterase domain-containing protein